MLPVRARQSRVLEQVAYPIQLGLPLRGDYPGSYGPTSSTAPTPASGFDWPAAGAGAAGMLGLILLLAAATSAMRIARNRSHRMRLSRTGR
jgi:hypothetical protein